MEAQGLTALQAFVLPVRAVESSMLYLDGKVTFMVDGLWG